MRIPLNLQISYAEQELSMYRAALPHMVKEGHCSAEMKTFRLAAGEAIVASLRMLLPPGGAPTTAQPVVCYFENEKQRAAFIKAFEKIKRM